MPTVHIRDFDDSRVADYRNVSDAELLERRGLFVAEGRLVVHRLLASSRYPARSLLVTETALASLHDAVAAAPDVPIYVCDLSLLRNIVGFNIHRGCLAIGERQPEPDIDALLEGRADRRRQGYGGPPKLHAEAEAPRRGQRNVVVVLERVGDADNVGSVFRNAAALGGEAVLLSPGCCDPLYRKSIRTSMGSVLVMPHGWLRAWPHDLEKLKAAGFRIVALTPSSDAIAIDAFSSGGGRVALLLGNEGEGLSTEALAHADRCVRIPMRPGIDSLNVATAAAIALHHLAPRL